MIRRHWALGIVLLLATPSIGSAQNPYYDHGLFPSPGTLGSSAAMRAELDLIEAGFAKLPTLAGNANDMVIVNSSGTALSSRELTGTAFPLSPSVGDIFLVRDDSASGACDSDGGTDWTLCAWDGSAWIPIGSGGGGGTTTWAALIASGSVPTNESSMLSIRGNPSHTTTGFNILTHTDGSPRFEPVCAGVVNGCDITVHLASGKFWRLTSLDEVSTYLRVDQSTGALTTATIDCSSGTVNCTVTKTKEFEFVACQDAVAYHIWNTTASSKPAAACDTANTNTIKGYASFDDTTDEIIYANMHLPTGYVAGSLGVRFVWKAAATSGAVGWCMQTVRVPDGTTSDQALTAQGAGNCVSDTAKGTTLQENHATIAAVTCTSCVALDDIKIGFSRDANGGAVTDSMTGDAHLIKAIVSWKELQ